MTTEQPAQNDYDRRSEELWASVDQYDKDVFRARVDELVAELPANSPVAACWPTRLG